MKRNLKLLLFVFALVLFLPLVTVNAEAVKMTGVSIDSGGIVHFDAVENTNTYWVGINDSYVPLGNASFNIMNRIQGRCSDEEYAGYCSSDYKGTYAFRIEARDADTELIGYYDAKLTYNGTSYSLEPTDRKVVVILYDSNGGSEVPYDVVEVGYPLVAPTSPTQDGFVFAGWYYDSALTRKVNFEELNYDRRTLYAKWNDTTVREVHINVEKPFVGYRPSMTLNSEEPDIYTAEVDYWYEFWGEYNDLNENSVFEDSKKYSIRFTVSLNEGYEYASDAVFYLNGEETSCYGHQFKREYTFDVRNTRINNIELGGITKPLAGQTPSTEGLVLTAEGANIKEANWYLDEENWQEKGPATKFVAGKKYILVVVFNEQKGYQMSEEFNEDHVTTNVAPLRKEYVKEGPDVRLYFEATDGTKITKTPVVKAKNANNNTISITWDEVDNATKYVLYRSTDNKKWTTIQILTGTSYIDTKLTYGKVYYYKVKAMNSKYNKTSAVVKAKTIPNKVENLTVKSTGSNNINLTWDKVGVNGYEVYSSTDNKKWTKVTTITKNTTLTFNNKKLKVNKVYYYKVRAYKTVSGKKVYGPFSAVLTAKTAPAKPTIHLTLYTYDGVHFVVDKQKGATHFMVETSPYSDFNDRTSEIAYGSYDGVYYVPTGDTTYVRARACNIEGHCSGWTTASLKVTPFTPTFTLATTTKKVTITLNSASGADGYQIYKLNTKTGKYTLLKEFTSSDELVFNDTTKKGTTYTYKVRSFRNVDGKRIYSPFSKIKKIVSK